MPPIIDKKISETLNNNDSLIHRRRGEIIAIIIFCISLTVTFFVWKYNSYVNTYQAKVSFQMSSQSTSLAIENGINHAVDELSGTSAYFATSGPIDRKQFHTYVSKMSSIQENSSLSSVLF